MEIKEILDNYYKNINISLELREFIKNYTSYPWMYYIARLDRIISKHPEYKKYILERICDVEEERIIRYQKDRYKNHLQDIEILNKEITNFNLPCDLVIYRGTTEKRFKDLTIKKDNEYQFLTNFSMTIYRDVARQHLLLDNPLLLEINLPTSYNALWISPFSFYSEEGEILLKEDIKFKLIKEDYINMAYYPRVKRLLLEPI